MKNKKTFNIITNAILIFTAAIIVLYQRFGLMSRGFENFSTQSGYYENYIDWSIMAWPLVLLIVSIVIGVVRLITTSIHNVKSNNDKGLAIFIAIMDALAVVGPILICTTYILWGCSTNDGFISSIAEENLEINILILEASGLSLLAVGSIISMCFTNKVMQNKKEA